MKKNFERLGTALLGSLIICTISLIQKVLINMPLQPRGFMVPFAVGALVGFLLANRNIRIKQINLALQEANCQLEEKVALRTKELEQINKELRRENSQRKKTEEEKERTIGELKDALMEIKTLQGFLPLCASCKRIRDDDGYWNQIEAYLAARTDLKFSHGICPDCADKFYPEYRAILRQKRFEQAQDAESDD